MADLRRAIMDTEAPGPEMFPLMDQWDREAAQHALRARRMYEPGTASRARANRSARMALRHYWRMRDQRRYLGIPNHIYLAKIESVGVD